jgi:two-component system, NarL family, sensor histidine kinase UhpB
MELGLLRDKIGPEQAARLDQIQDLIDTGIRSIRNVTNDLRPSLLDDLGLLPALRSLVAEFADRSGIHTGLDLPPVMPPLSLEAELALFRALQEALTNVLRHANARSVEIGVSLHPEGVLLRVSDDGRGLPPGTSAERLEWEGHMGLAGMRERITALGGNVRVRAPTGAGVSLEVLVPALAGASA